MHGRVVTLCLPIRAQVTNTEWERRALAAGVDVMAGYGIAEAHGRRCRQGCASGADWTAQRNTVIGNGPFIACDALGSSGGLSPTVHLYCHDGGRPVWDDARLAFVAPATGRAKSGIYCAGAVTGEFGLQAALEQTLTTVNELLSQFRQASGKIRLRLSHRRAAVNARAAYFPRSRRKA